MKKKNTKKKWMFDVRKLLVALNGKEKIPDTAQNTISFIRVVSHIK